MTRISTMVSPSAMKRGRRQCCQRPDRAQNSFQNRGPDNTSSTSQRLRSEKRGRRTVGRGIPWIIHVILTCHHPLSGLPRSTELSASVGMSQTRQNATSPKTAAVASRGPVSWRAGPPAMQQTAQLGRPRRNLMIAALTSAGRSCWVQWPQPASIWMSRRRGTCCFMLAICSAAPGNATTRS
jgi:hypothetical protein